MKDKQVKDIFFLTVKISSVCFFWESISHFDLAIFLASEGLEATTKPNSCFSCIELGSYPPIFTNHNFLLGNFSFLKILFFGSLFSLFLRFIL